MCVCLCACKGQQWGKVDPNSNTERMWSCPSVAGQSHVFATSQYLVQNQELAHFILDDIICCICLLNIYYLPEIVNKQCAVWLQLAYIWEGRFTTLTIIIQQGHGFEFQASWKLAVIINNLAKRFLMIISLSYFKYFRLVTKVSRIQCFMTDLNGPSVRGRHGFRFCIFAKAEILQNTSPMVPIALSKLCEALLHN